MSMHIRIQMRTFGEINGVSPGDIFDNREALAKAKVHPPLVAGISGGKNEGADSIVLSGAELKQTELKQTPISNFVLFMVSN
ncbi:MULTISPECIES: YDG/SRA domain-containing protein [unclassified Pseudoalteromonas]|uniref:YDG/SRA domain-containing protein n=1 Tax=unclassified Pseudoalteromonas TaxID=194690 RepID=UPI0018CC5EFE|nr:MULTISPECIES: YDG/SRA domain-containing protein [unclassified Pseudoalteromonas]